jgi:hypothetical protein
MSDETPDEAADETVPAARRPSPSSRARRIGGRPTPRPTPQPAGEPSPGAPEPARPRPSLTKPAVRPTPEPEREIEPEVESEPTEREGGGWQRWIPAGVLGVAAVALVVVLVVVSHGVYWAKTDDAAGARAAKQEQVLAAAKKCFATVNTYDYRKLSGVIAKDLPCTTGKFKTDLKEALQKTIIPQAPKTKSVQSAQVNRAGVISVNGAGTQLVALIYGQLVVTNSTTAKTTPRTDLFGAVVTMDRVGSDWLISKVGFDAGNGLGG